MLPSIQYTQLKKGLLELSFDFESFFNGVSFFFKLSSVRREDYKEVTEVASVAAEFAKKFGAILHEDGWCSLY